MPAHGCTSVAEIPRLTTSAPVSQANPPTLGSAGPGGAQPLSGSAERSGWTPAQTSAQGLHMAENAQMVHTPLQGDANSQEK